MNKNKMPIAINTNPPTLVNPLFVKTLQSFGSFSLGSGLCNQSSCSTSSGNNNKPGDGVILYFSASVCVFRCSSSIGPSLELGLESSNGEKNGCRLPISELKLVLRDDCAEPVCENGSEGGASRYMRFPINRFGGSSISELSTIDLDPYTDDTGLPAAGGGGIGLGNSCLVDTDSELL